MAKRSGPTYLIQNRHGVYYFQRRLPVFTPLFSNFLRLSLRTKKKSDALALARRIAVMWDLRAKQFFKNEDDYHRGSKLLRAYLATASRASSFEELSRDFLDNLDDTTDHESDLLDRAANLHASRQLDAGHDPYAVQIANLTALINSKFVDTAPASNTSTSVATTMLSDAFKDFLTSHRGGWKKNSGMESSYRDTFFPFLLSIVGDIPTSSITKNHVNDVVKILLVFPSNKTKKRPYKDYATLDFLNIDTPDEDRLSPTTKKKYLTQIGTFLRWLKLTDLTTIDLDTPLKTVKLPKTRAADQKSIFTCADIRSLFNSADYTQGKHKTASRFWVPLIALYTGARLNEVCQLSVNDVRIDPDSNRWIFDFNENDDVPQKSLKRPHHARLVPMHKKLIELGFLDYIKRLSRKNSLIFPELNYAGEVNKYGNEIQRWFNRTYLGAKHCNISTPNTSFHSLRHTVITHLATVHNVQENQVAAGLGQTAKGGVYETRYTKHAFSTYAKFFDLINFDNCYDSKKIRDWKHHLFAR